MNAHAARLLAPGAAPLVARRHEVAAARSLQAEQVTAPASTPKQRGCMPFIGLVLDYLPGQRIAVERLLTLDEDLHLADHHFVPANGVKPLSACYPVLPMTFSLEIMAEIAACLAPGLGLCGFERVSAGRWIALEDSGTLALRIEARASPPPAIGVAGALRHITVAVYAAGQHSAAISATVLFGASYESSLALSFPEAPTEVTLEAAAIYAKRQLFHGPRLRPLTGQVTLHGAGIRATLRTRATHDLFRSHEQPCLLTDPALLDGIGQMMGIWAMRRQRISFPVGIGKFELYGPTPAPGTAVGALVRITASSAKTISADVELDDGAGRVWLRVRDWKSWLFQWDGHLIDFRRAPTRHLLSETLVLPGVDGAALCQRMTAARGAGIDRTLLARHYLHLNEMAPFAAMGAVPQRQLSWLLGRIAAKDAVRAWSAARDNAPRMLHPAAFSIGNTGSGQPLVLDWPHAHRPPPALSIAHCDDQALAMVAAGACGIDIERVVARAPAFLASIASPAEAALLPQQPAALLPSSVTRLWCAKEVLGKLLSIGVTPGPRHFQARRIDGAGTLLMEHRSSGRTASVRTLLDGDYLCAYAVAADG